MGTMLKTDVVENLFFLNFISIKIFYETAFYFTRSSKGVSAGWVPPAAQHSLSTCPAPMGSKVLIDIWN
jgi:hypothetical protein